MFAACAAFMVLACGQRIVTRRQRRFSESQCGCRRSIPFQLYGERTCPQQCSEATISMLMKMLYCSLTVPHLGLPRHSCFEAVMVLCCPDKVSRVAPSSQPHLLSRPQPCAWGRLLRMPSQIAPHSHYGKGWAQCVVVVATIVTIIAIVRA